MPVTRERVDPIRSESELGLVHRRWILPDDVQRAVALPQLARLWRGLLDLGVLNAREEVWLQRFGQSDQADMPAPASPGALLAASGAAVLLTQVVWTDEDGRRDPYAFHGEADPAGFRDYTLYAVDAPGQLLLPIPPVTVFCSSNSHKVPVTAPRFGEGVLLDLKTPCSCGAAIDLGRDKGELRNGAVFLLEELACRAALSIELPRAPQSEELPDAQVAALLQESFGGTDELADDQVPAAE